MERLSAAVGKYLNAQIAAGAEAVQIFDSWVGCLSPDDYQKYVLPHMKATIAAITPGTPVIHFSTGTAGMLKLIKEAGGDVIGLDWRIHLDQGWAGSRYDVGVRESGSRRAAGVTEATASVEEILKRAAGKPGHISIWATAFCPKLPSSRDRDGRGRARAERRVKRQGLSHDAVLLLAFGGPAAPEDIRLSRARARGHPAPPGAHRRSRAPLRAVGGRRR
jgi:hypothetical protein